MEVTHLSVNLPNMLIYLFEIDTFKLSWISVVISKTCEWAISMLSFMLIK